MTVKRRLGVWRKQQQEQKGQRSRRRWRSKGSGAAEKAEEAEEPQKQRRSRRSKGEAEAAEEQQVKQKQGRGAAADVVGGAEGRYAEGGRKYKTAKQQSDTAASRHALHAKLTIIIASG